MLPSAPRPTDERVLTQRSSTASETFVEYETPNLSGSEIVTIKRMTSARTTVENRYAPPPPVEVPATRPAPMTPAVSPTTASTVERVPRTRPSPSSRGASPFKRPTAPPSPTDVLGSEATSRSSFRVESMGTGRPPSPLVHVALRQQSSARVPSPRPPSPLVHVQRAKSAVTPIEAKNDRISAASRGQPRQSGSRPQVEDKTLHIMRDGVEVDPATYTPPKAVMPESLKRRLDSLSVSPHRSGCRSRTNSRERDTTTMLGTSRRVMMSRDGASLKKVSPPRVRPPPVPANREQDPNTRLPTSRPQSGVRGGTPHRGEKDLLPLPSLSMTTPFSATSSSVSNANNMSATTQQRLTPNRSNSTTLKERGLTFLPAPAPPAPHDRPLGAVAVQSPLADSSSSLTASDSTFIPYLWRGRGGSPPKSRPLHTATITLPTPGEASSEKSKTSANATTIQVTKVGTPPPPESTPASSSSPALPSSTTIPLASKTLSSVIGAVIGPTMMGKTTHTSGTTCGDVSIITPIGTPLLSADTLPLDKPKGAEKTHDTNQAIRTQEESAMSGDSERRRVRDVVEKREAGSRNNTDTNTNRSTVLPSSSLAKRETHERTGGDDEVEANTIAMNNQIKNKNTMQGLTRRGEEEKADHTSETLPLIQSSEPSSSATTIKKTVDGHRSDASGERRACESSRADDSNPHSPRKPLSFLKRLHSPPQKTTEKEKEREEAPQEAEKQNEKVLSPAAAAVLERSSALQRRSAADSPQRRNVRFLTTAEEESDGNNKNDKNKVVAADSYPHLSTEGTQIGSSSEGAAARYPKSGSEDEPAGGKNVTSSKAIKTYPPPTPPPPKASAVVERKVTPTRASATSNVTGTLLLSDTSTSLYSSRLSTSLSSSSFVGRRRMVPAVVTSWPPVSLRTINHHQRPTQGSYHRDGVVSQAVLLAAVTEEEKGAAAEEEEHANNANTKERTAATETVQKNESVDTRAYEHDGDVKGCVSGSGVQPPANTKEPISSPAAAFSTGADPHDEEEERGREGEREGEESFSVAVDGTVDVSRLTDEDFSTLRDIALLEAHVRKWEKEIQALESRAEDVDVLAGVLQEELAAGNDAVQKHKIFEAKSAGRRSPLTPLSNSPAPKAAANGNSPGRRREDQATQPSREEQIRRGEGVEGLSPITTQQSVVDMVFNEISDQIDKNNNNSVPLKSASPSPSPLDSILNRATIVLNADGRRGLNTRLEKAIDAERNEKRALEQRVKRLQRDLAFAKSFDKSKAKQHQKHLDELSDMCTALEMLSARESAREQRQLRRAKQCAGEMIYTFNGLITDYEKALLEASAQDNNMQDALTELQQKKEQRRRQLREEEEEECKRIESERAAEVEAEAAKALSSLNEEKRRRREEKLRLEQSVERDRRETEERRLQELAEAQQAKLEALLEEQRQQGEAMLSRRAQQYHASTTTTASYSEESKRDNDEGGDQEDAGEEEEAFNGEGMGLLGRRGGPFIGSRGSGGGGRALHASPFKGPGKAQTRKIGYVPPVPSSHGSTRGPPSSSASVSPPRRPTSSDATNSFRHQQQQQSAGSGRRATSAPHRGEGGFSSTRRVVGVDYSSGGSRPSTPTATATAKPTIVASTSPAKSGGIGRIRSASASGGSRGPSVSDAPLVNSREVGGASSSNNNKLRGGVGVGGAKAPSATNSRRSTDATSNANNNNNTNINKIASTTSQQKSRPMLASSPSLSTVSSSFPIYASTDSTECTKHRNPDAAARSKHKVHDPIEWSGGANILSEGDGSTVGVSISQIDVTKKISPSRMYPLTSTTTAENTSSPASQRERGGGFGMKATTTTAATPTARDVKEFVRSAQPPIVAAAAAATPTPAADRRGDTYSFYVPSARVPASRMDDMLARVEQIPEGDGVLSVNARRGSSLTRVENPPTR